MAATRIWDSQRDWGKSSDEDAESEKDIDLSSGSSVENIEDEGAEEDPYDLHIDMEDQPTRKDSSSDIGDAVEEDDDDIEDSEADAGNTVDSQPLVIQVRSRAELQRLYMAAYDSGDYLAIANLIWESELENPQSRLKAFGEHEEGVLRDIIHILALTNHDLLGSIVSCTLPVEACQLQSPVAQAIARLPVQGTIPIEYSNWLVDAQGHSPCPLQLATAAQRVMRYTNLPPEEGDDDVARAIDNAVNAWTGQRRRYFRSGRARRVIRDFARDVIRRCRDLPEEMREQPLEFALGEVGYTKDPDWRFRVHRNHAKDSNYLMNIFEAALCSLFPQFRILQLPLFICLGSTQAWLGEIVFTQLLHAYTHEARGFNHCAAGLSTNTVQYFFNDQDWEQIRRRAEEPAKEKLRDAIERVERQEREEEEEFAHVEAELVKLRAKVQEMSRRRELQRELLWRQDRNT